MVESEKKTKQKPDYEIKGISLHAYLDEAGEFRWTPTTQTCNDKVNTERFFEVIKSMPEKRRAVWASRLDTKQAKMTCPIIQQEPDLQKEFDEILVVYQKSEMKETEKRKGGENQGE